MPEVAEVPREAALAQMRMIDGLIAGRHFISGERYTIADITAMVALGLGAVVGPTVDSGLAKDALVRRGVGAAERPRLMVTVAPAISDPGRPGRFRDVMEIPSFPGAVPKVRVHLPPADSPSLSEFRLRSWKSPGFPPVWGGCQTARSAETRRSSNIGAEEPVVSLSGDISVPRCRRCGSRRWGRRRQAPVAPLEIQRYRKA